VTENEVLSAGGNPVTQTVKFALKGLTLNMAAELLPHGVAAVAITPGFLRSETMLERFSVTEETWREGGERSELLGIGVPVVRGSRCCSIGGRPGDIRAFGTTLQLLGTRP
jgi:NAD(P)-dependent dehydrogenase (short-subunit alcohol dehydrogenase family)